MSKSFRDLINNTPMSRFQIIVIVICTLINMMDGFDVLVMAFTAPAISKEWGLNGTQLGMLFSSGLVGMAAGSLFLAPFGDSLGRRNNVIICVVITIIGMFLSAFTHNYIQLMCLRVLTGIGIGGLLASTNTIAAEFSSDKRRGLCIGIVTTGYTVGAICGGLSVILISDYGWRAVFMFGALCSLLLLPAILYFLPESLDFLLANNVKNRLKRINSLLARMGHDKISTEPGLTEKVQYNRFGPMALLTGEYRVTTLLMWTSFFVVMATLYFILNWTPKLLVSAGLSTEQGISGGILLNISGILGQLILGYISARFNLYKLIIAYMALTSLSMILFGAYLGSLHLAMLYAVFIGFFVFGVFVGLYTLSPRIYPANIRNTGLGWAIGIGRIGAIISPLLAGILYDANWSIFGLYLLFSIPMILAIISIRAIMMRVEKPVT